MVGHIGGRDQIVLLGNLAPLSCWTSFGASSAMVMESPGVQTSLSSIFFRSVIVILEEAIAWLSDD
ncbi:hypothetical protein BJX99DRAFT_233412 [Aspergillus californicus]